MCHHLCPTQEDHDTTVEVITDGWRGDNNASIDHTRCDRERPRWEVIWKRMEGSVAERISMGNHFDTHGHPSERDIWEVGSWVRFPHGHQLRLGGNPPMGGDPAYPFVEFEGNGFGQPDEAPLFSEAIENEAKLNRFVERESERINGAIYPYYSACSYLREPDLSFQSVPSRQGNTWVDNTYNGTLSEERFKHPLPGEPPKAAIALFAQNKFLEEEPWLRDGDTDKMFAQPEPSVVVSTCTCLREKDGKMYHYYKLPPPPYCIHQTHVLTYCTQPVPDDDVKEAPSPPPPPTPPPPPFPPGVTCANSCPWAFNGVCDESDQPTSARCAYGTDCHDCGARFISPPPPPLPPEPPPPIIQNTFVVPPAQGTFRGGLNRFEVSTSCGLRAVGGVSLGWGLWRWPTPLSLTDLEHNLSFSSLPAGSHVKARFYATNAAGRTGYVDTSPIILDDTPPRVPPLTQVLPCEGTARGPYRADACDRM